MALTDNLVSYYKLDESSGNAADSVGSNTLTNTNVTYAAAKINNGAVYDSTSDYLEIADASQTGLDLAGNCSFSFWWKGTLPTSGNIINFFQKYGTNGTTGSYRAFLYNNSGTYQAIIDLSADGSTDDRYTKNVTVSADTWYHFVFTWTAATSKGNWYQNGSALGELTGSATSLYNNAIAFIIGNNPNHNAGSNAYFDEFSVFNRALSSTEVTALYNSGNGKQYPFAASGPANLKSYNTNAKANIKSINTNAIANVKSLNTNS